jgi:hypothetical protein
VESTFNFYADHGAIRRQLTGKVSGTGISVAFALPAQAVVCGFRETRQCIPTPRRLTGRYRLCEVH